MNDTKGHGLIMRYFVLSPDKDTTYGKASRAALAAYAEEIHASNPQLATDVEAWVKKIRHRLQKS